MRAHTAATAHPAPPRRTVLLALLVGAVALGYRLAVLNDLTGQPTLQVLGLDSRFYHDWATRLAAGATSRPDPFFMGPLYPHFLGALYALTGPHVHAVRLLQVVLGALAAMLVFDLGRRAFGLLAGTFAGLALALYGYGAFLELHLAMEPLLAWLALAMLATLLSGLSRASAWRLALAGGLLGLLAAGRASYLVLLPVLVAIVWAWERGRESTPRAAARLSGWLAAGCLAALAPLVVHNARTGGGLALLTTNGGINYYIGNHDGATGAFLEPDGIDFFQSGVGEDGGSIALASRRAGRSLSATQASRYWFQQGLRWNAAHPGRTLRLWARKLTLLLCDYQTPQIENFDQGRAESALLRLTPSRFGWLAAMACAGMALAWRADRRVRLLALLLGATVVSLLPFFVTARYRYPSMPIWCLLAGVGAARLWQLARAGRAVSAVAALGATAALAVMLHVARPAGVQAAARVMPMYNAGVMALQGGDFATAARNFQAVLEQQPDHLESQANLGFCLLQVGQVPQALAVLSQALERDPQNLRVLQLVAHGQLLSGQDAEAEGSLLRMLQITPTDAWALLQLGDLADRRGDVTRARDLWQQALGSADPTLAPALRQRLASRPPVAEP